jgi:hypothetical protein
MTDRELLELAAKAAGIDRLDFGRGAILASDDEGHTAVWDPLKDDGDALRLAVSLVMTVRVRLQEVAVWAPGGDEVTEPYTAEQGSRIAATRRAIVRAAAAIGRQP